MQALGCPEPGIGSDLWPGARRERRTEDGTMKYMIMMFGCLGEAIVDRSPEWVGGMHELLVRLDGELRESGELVDSRRLIDPTAARTVRLVDGAPAPTDGPFAEVKESLAGYWVIEGTEERAVEIVSEVVAYTGVPMEIRRVMDEPPPA
jgi:hypothetical protein